MDDRLRSLLEAFDCVVEPTGSRVTCNPAPTETDADYLVQAPNDVAALSAVVCVIEGEGFSQDGATEHYQDVTGDGFLSWRRDEINLIVTKNPLFAKRHRAATALCRHLNLMEKDDRIALFQAVLYGNKREKTDV